MTASGRKLNVEAPLAAKACLVGVSPTGTQMRIAGSCGLCCSEGIARPKQTSVESPTDECFAPFCSVGRGWAASVGQALQTCLRFRLSQEERRADIGIAPPLAVALRDERHLMAAPGLERQTARLVAPRDRIEHLEAAIVAAVEQPGLVAARGVEHGNPEAD